MHKVKHEISGTITKLAMLAAILTTLAMPAIYLASGYRYQQGSLETEAEITAEVVNTIVAENPDYWRYQQLRLEEMLVRRSLLKPMDRRIVDLAGKEIAANRLSRHWPSLTVRAPIVDAGITVAHLEISKSLYPLLIRAALISIGGLAIGLVVFASIKLVPLKALEIAQHELEENERKYHALFSNLSEAVFIVDSAAMTVIESNMAGVRLSGLAHNQLKGMEISVLFGSSAAEITDYLQKTAESHGAVSVEIEWQRIGRQVKISITVTAAGQLALICEDVTERRQSEQKMQQMAYYDALTGLPNRMLLYDRIKQAMARADRTGTKLALLFLDLDSFKPINDSLGHEAGDRVLEQIAERLMAGTRAADTVARFAGDEFVMLVSDLQDRGHAELIGEGVIARLSAPYKVGSKEVHCGCSIGVAIYPDEGLSADTLISHADMAMYAAKEQGGNSCVSYDFLLKNSSVSPKQSPA